MSKRFAEIKFEGRTFKMELPPQTCNSCGNPFSEGEPKFKGGASAKYGVYYKYNSPDICRTCLDKKFFKAKRFFELNNKKLNQ